MSLVQVGEELGDGVQITINPSAKRIKLEEPEGDQQSVKQILFNINKAICLRLDSIESKLEALFARSKLLEEKVDIVNDNLQEAMLRDETGDGSSAVRKSGAVIVGLPQNRTAVSPSGNQPLDGAMNNLGPNVTLITLNSEEDFPNGSWLGDETNPEMRVRVCVSPSDLLHIHSNCRTPEKMALTLLDYLFDRETQAISNLSGTGKHGKRQLDPLMIYGIRCHLISRFAITEQDWHRIKLNIDSKCRTAFRRRIKGLPLTVKGFRGLPGGHRALQLAGMEDLEDVKDHDECFDHGEEDSGELQITGDQIDLTSAEVAGLTTSQLIAAAGGAGGVGGGEIQVLHATPEQVAQLQQTHQIQILQGEHVLGQLSSGELSAENIQVAVSLPSQADHALTIIGGAEAADAIHINADPATAAELVADSQD